MNNIIRAERSTVRFCEDVEVDEYMLDRREWELIEEQELFFAGSWN